MKTTSPTKNKFRLTLLATLLAALFAPAVHATDYTITGDEDTQQTLSNDYDTLVIEASGTLRTTTSGTGNVANSAPAILASGKHSAVTNKGTLTTTGDYAYGIYATGDNATLINSGTISTSGLWGVGIVSYGADHTTLTNSGTISTSGQNGRGIHSEGDYTTFTNSGTISTSGEYGFGIFSSGDNTTFTNSGTITTVGEYAAGFELNGDHGTITNSGTITTVGEHAAGFDLYGDHGTITNSGTISTSGSQHGHGIFSYGKNVTITNSGSITVSGTDAIGICVDGSGDNTLLNISGHVIATGSATKAIVGGAGDETLNLYNGAKIVGTIDLGGGTNLLTLEDLGTFIGDISNITTLTKTGSGTWSTTGSISTDTLTVSDGTLQVKISQTATPTIKATGTVTNNSTVLFSLNTPIATGTTFTALTGAGGLGGTGTYTTTPFLTAAVNANSVDLTKNSFTDVFRGIDQTWEQVAEALDDNYGTATGDLADLIWAIEQSGSRAEAESAMAQLTSPLLGQSMDLTLGAARLQSLVTQSRMAGRRTYLAYQDRKALDRDDPGSWPLIAAMGDLSGLLGRSPEDHPQSLYLRTAGRTGSMDSHGVQSGYDHQTFILSGGYDHVLGNSVLAGISAGYGTAQADYDDQGGSRSVTDSYALGVYGSWFRDHWYVDAVLAGIYNRHDLHRELPVLDATAKAAPDGYTLSAKTEGGYRFQAGNWGLTPRVALEYTRFHQDGYTETGAGAANLVMGDTDSNFLESGLGLTVDRTWKTGRGMVIPELSAMWLHQWLTQDRAITYAMTGLPGTVFSDTLAEASENTLRLGAGVRFLLDEKNLILTARYQGDLEEHARSHSLLAEVQFVF